jgi:hypothetical protein
MDNSRRKPSSSTSTTESPRADTDYRRSAVRDLILAGVDRVTAKLISGHARTRVFERYAIMTEHEKEQGLAKLQEFRAAGSLATPQLRKPLEGDSKNS